MQETPLISIIMPCYNCATILREAFHSIYRQNFTSPFEVVMVDDGSTDTTLETIKSLIADRPECQLIRHEHNKGGGAARNTAVKASKGEIIFCLDSDDVLADNSLPPMIEFLQKESLDGAIFKHRRFFSSDTTKYEEVSNPDVSREILISDIFESTEKRILFNNFVHTKKAYETAGGYPEDHGFDTQEFEYKFLAKNLKSKICPNSIYYHRQAIQKSYFDREYEKGLFSINTYLALEPILEYLSDGIIDLCVQFDITTKNELKNENNLLGAISKQYINDGTMLFAGNERSARCKAFIEASSLLRDGQYDEALLKLENCGKLYGEVTPLLLFNITRARHGSSGTPKVKVIDETLQWFQNCGILKARKMRRLPSPILKLYLLCKTLFLGK